MARSHEVLFSAGAIRELHQCIESLAAKRLLFVVDRLAYEACGAKKEVDRVLNHFRVSGFADFNANPKVEDIERGVKLFQQTSPDLIIALGGGSSIDIAKLIGLISVQDSNTMDLILGNQSFTKDACPLIAIPTTAGTGSEATHFAVAYVGDKKFSVAHKSLLPTLAIVDPELTTNLPPSLTATTGLDAFCQAMESAWAVGSTEESVSYAIQALRLAWDNLYQAVTSPTKESRFAMAMASNLAGQAINISKTTSSHALSYFMTARYGIPHGRAVALTISRMLAFNAGVTSDDCVDQRGWEHVRHRISKILLVLGGDSVEHTCLRIDQFIRSLGCPSTLSEAGIGGKDQIQRIVESVNLERMSNNPRRCSQSQLINLLRGTSHSAASYSVASEPKNH